MLCPTSTRSFLLALGLLCCFSVFFFLKSKEFKEPDQQEEAKSADAGIASTGDSAGAELDWSQLFGTYQSASGGRRYQMLPDLIAEAKLRAERMRVLIKTDPEAALERVLSLAEYSQLPDALRPYFERPVSGFGDIDLRWRTYLAPGGGLRCSHENRLYIDGISYNLYGPGRREDQSPALNVPVVAYVMEELALIPESPVLSITGDDIAAAKALFGAGEEGEFDPLTNAPVDPEVAALIGGRVYHFSGIEIVEEVTATLQAAESATADSRNYTMNVPYGWLAGDRGGDAGGIAQSSFFADDSISVLFIRCDFSDFQGAPVSRAALETDLAIVSDHLNTMSYQTASLSTSVTSTVYRATGDTGTSYALSGDDDALYDDVVARYDANPDYDPSSTYDVVAIYFPDLGDVPNSKIGYGGLASVGGSRQWINGLSNSFARTEVITHEFGHNYGLFHANYWHPERAIDDDPDDYNDPNGNSLEYGDIFDTMGSGELPESHFSHYQKNRIDWMDDSKVQEVTVNGTYRIHRFDHVDADDNPVLALRVPMESGVHYWIGFRQLYTSNANAFDGAYVVAEGLYENRPNLIDMTPGSQISESSDRDDACLPVGESFYDSNSGVTIAAVSKGTDGPGDEWLDVQIDFESRISIAGDTYEFDEASGMAYVTVERIFSGNGAASIDYATSDGSAQAGSDYYASSGTITWEDGETGARQIALLIKPDALDEGIEDFMLTLSNPSGAVLDVAQTSTFISILDPGQRFSAFAPDFFNNSVYAIGFQSDGRLIIGGTINSSSGDFSGAGNIARINNKGEVDPGFNPGGSGFDGRVNAVLVLPDDSIVVGGDFTEYNGVTVNRVARLSSDGLLDNNFGANVGGAADAEVYALALQKNGQILVAGAFDNFNSAGAEGLIRINNDGTFGDALTLPFTGINVRDVFEQADGQIMVAGAFSVAWTGSGFRSGVLRLDPDGSRDPTFDPDAGLHALSGVGGLRNGNTLARLPDGDYLVGGWFEAYDENPAGYFVRINSDGTFDRVLDSALDDTARVILAEPFGAALVGGSFSIPRARLLRVDNDWALDGDFFSSGGPSGTVYALEYGPDGSLWAGGNFFNYNGSSSRPIVRLASGVSPYDWWVQKNFTRAQIAAGDADPNQDPDRDTIANLAELALGTNPVEADSSSVFGSGNLSGLSLVEASGNQYLQMTLDKSALDGGVWYCVQLSSDLINWTPDPATPGDQSAYDILEDSPNRLTIRDKTPVSAGSPRFARIVFKTPK